MSENFLKEIQDSFLVEAEENLAQAESLFLLLEKPEEDHHTILLKLKRVAHNFKGSGKTVGFDELSSFSHSLENLLIALSSNALTLTSDVIDLLLKCNDALKKNLTELKSDPSAKLDRADLLLQIEQFLKGAHYIIDIKTEAEPAFMALQAPIKSLFGHEKHHENKCKNQEHSEQNQHKEEPSKSGNEESIRVPLKKIDDILNSFGEQVIFLSTLDHYKDNLLEHQDELIRTIYSLKRTAFDLQQYTLSLRMINLRTLFAKLERAIRDTARETGKKVISEFIGQDQELDKNIVDQLADPLIHMLRNAVDHGIESEKERVASGKINEGHIKVIAHREGSSFVLEIIDDGKGLDPAKIREKALRSGLIKENQYLSEKETIDLIYENGFSTKDKVSEISGRGVGMNVVKTVIQTLNGSCDTSSEIGKGTHFRIKLPLSLSLFNGIVTQIGQSKYIIPSSQVVEFVNFDEVEIRLGDDGKKYVQIREKIHLLFELPNVLKTHLPQVTNETPEEKNNFHADHGKVKTLDKSNHENETNFEKIKNKSVNINNNENKLTTVKSSQRNMILVSEIENKHYCFLINQVYNISRVVQKPLSPEITFCPGAVGVSILGDGSPIIILDLRILKNFITNNFHQSNLQVGNLKINSEKEKIA